MGEGLAGIEPISCYTCIQRTVDNIPGNLALVSGDRYSHMFHTVLILIYKPLS